MWFKIKNENELREFLKSVNHFHDGCIKELKYLSGAYVNADLSMHPVNDRRELRIIIQTQNADSRVIELKFKGLKFLTLLPIDDAYTCEISGCSMYFKDGYIYWCDREDVDKITADAAEGTAVCALSAQWRKLQSGAAEEYYRIVP